MSEIAELARAVRLKADTSMVAPKFSPARRYLPGRPIVYDGVLYKCTTEHYGKWDESHFEPSSMSDVVSQCLKTWNVAPMFSGEAHYEEGDVVIKDGILVQCIEKGHGTGAKFRKTSIISLLDKARSDVEEVNKVATGASRSVEKLAADLVDLSSKMLRLNDSAMGLLAPAWKSENVYRPGEIVSHEGRLYCCVNHHGGREWDATQWLETSLAGAIDGLADAMRSAMQAAR